MNWCLLLWTTIGLIWSCGSNRFKPSILNRLSSERGEKQGDYALLVALVVVAALAILFVMGPQVAMVYAQSVQSGTGTP